MLFLCGIVTNKIWIGIVDMFLSGHMLIMAIREPGFHQLQIVWWRETVSLSQETNLFYWRPFVPS